MASRHRIDIITEGSTSRRKRRSLRRNNTTSRSNHHSVGISKTIQNAEVEDGYFDDAQNKFRGFQAEFDARELTTEEQGKKALRKLTKSGPSQSKRMVTLFVKVAGKPTIRSRVDLGMHKSLEDFTDALKTRLHTEKFVIKDDNGMLAGMEHGAWKVYQPESIRVEVSTEA